jgi:hypothetical protein
MCLPLAFLAGREYSRKGFEVGCKSWVNLGQPQFLE